MPEARAHANNGMRVNFGGPKALTIFPFLKPNTLPLLLSLGKTCYHGNQKSHTARGDDVP